MCPTCFERQMLTQQSRTLRRVDSHTTLAHCTIGSSASWFSAFHMIIHTYELGKGFPLGKGVCTSADHFYGK